MEAMMETHGFGDEKSLMKIDKLFACGVGEHVDLPQIIAVGDQSSGKSSILEALTGKAFPRDSGLCTRFSTQFIFRRANEQRISVSIIPDPRATMDHRKKVESWRKGGIELLDSAMFVKIMTEVHDIMGVSQTGDTSGRKSTFSNDVLRLEIAGPSQEHLSVIDVPGIFKNTTPGMTTKDDIEMVRKMVLGYMENPRTVMLAVVPANVDVATQEILELARNVDPAGNRTLGVLTKPDLVDEGAENRVIDLVERRDRLMKLGWHVVRNPGQQQLIEKTTNRAQVEAEFFKTRTPWKSLGAEVVGVEALRARIKDVLSSLVKQEFPKVKMEVTKRLTEAQNRMQKLGPERNSPSEQTAYLTEVCTKYQQLVVQSLQGGFSSSQLLESNRQLYLAPLVSRRFEMFDNEMARVGHEYAFNRKQILGKRDASHLDSDSEEDKELPPYPPQRSDLVGKGKTPTEPVIPHKGQPRIYLVRKEHNLPELEDILLPQQGLPGPFQNQIIDWLNEQYQLSRGFELGTFNTTVLTRTMKRQSLRWESFSLGFVSDVVVFVHRFIRLALESLCCDGRMVEALLKALSEELRDRYLKAMAHVKFLLECEREEVPLTANHYFNDNLEKSRQARLRSSLMKLSEYDGGFRDNIVKLGSTPNLPPMSNTDHIIREIHDILQSYYKVARKRFVDNVIVQAVGHFLVTGKDTPLNVFSAKFVFGLAPTQLEDIVGEPPAMKRERVLLAKEIASLTEAKKILIQG